MADRGWDAFRAELVAHLEDMADVDAVIVDVLPPLETTAVRVERSWLSRKLRPKRTHDGHPYIQFAALDETWLHMEASSNTFLTPERRLDGAAMATLDRLGWTRPTVEAASGIDAPNYFIDRPVAEAHELAAVAVQTLTQVFGVREPAGVRISQV